MKKIANLSFSISSREPVKKNPEVIEFSTQDTNTATFRFEIKDGKEPLNLTDIDGKVSLIMKDDSRFDGQAEVTDPLKGIMEYTIPPEQIKHIGKGEGELVLIKGEEKLAGLYFDFTIKPSLIDKDLKPVKDYYIADLEVVKKEVYEKAAQINVDMDALNAEIDTRVSDVENKVNGFESNVAQATVVQVDAAKKDTTGQTHSDLDSRIKAEVGKIETKQGDLTSQLAEMPKKNELTNSNLVGVNQSTSIERTIADSFSRPNSNVLSSEWEVSTGTWGIVDNQAAVLTDSGSNRALVDSKSNDGEVEVIFSKNTGAARLIFRHSDANNEWYLLADTPTGQYRLGKRVAGTAAVVQTFNASITDGAKIKVKFNGSNIKCFVNGLKVIEVNDASNQNATKHGIGNNGSTATRFKNFKIKTLPKINYPTTLIASVDNMLVDYKFGTLFLSKDGGYTYTESLSIPDIPIIKFIHLFADGRVMFADHMKIYYSHDWKTYHEATVLNKDGTPYVPTQNDNFSSYKNSSIKKIVDGLEMAVWGNYSTVQYIEATDKMKVWYTADYGKTVKICYVFNTPGSESCRHIHNVDFNPNDNSFWIQTGDEANGAKIMSHWIKGTYNKTNDTWSWNTFASGDNFKSTNLIFWSDGYAYWSWDKSPGGVVRAPINTMGDVSTHQVLFSTNKDCNNIFIGKSGDMVVFQTKWGGTEAARIMYYSPDRVTFHRIVGDVPREFDDMIDAQYQAHWAPNANGKILCGIQSLSQQDIKDWNRKPSLFIDDYIREYGYPNAFK